MFKIWWGVFCMDVSGNLGGRILGKYFCNMRHNHWVNGVWKRNCIVWGLGLAPVSDPGSLRCAWSSSLSPGLPCRYRRSEEAQGSGFVPLWVIQWQALLWVGCSQAVLKMWGSQVYFSIVLTKLLKKVEINQWDISGLKFHECSRTCFLLHMTISKLHWLWQETWWLLSLALFPRWSFCFCCFPSPAKGVCVSHRRPIKTLCRNFRWIYACGWSENCPFPYVGTVIPVGSKENLFTWISRKTC